jgi:diguanylate cyclase (GGDEF)-like protein/PAS domain S-box-containing protein
VPADRSTVAGDDLRVEGSPDERDYYLTALEIMGVGLLVLDREARVLLRNSVSERTFTLSAHGDGVVAQGPYDVVREDGSPWPVDDRPVRRAAIDGRVTVGALMGVVQDGRTRWLRITAQPLVRPGETTPYAGLGTFLDVTAPLGTEQALRESEAHFRLLAENSTDVISRHSADGTIRYMSPAVADVVGRPPADLLGTPAIALSHADDHPGILRSHREILATGEGATLRHRWVHADGHLVWAETVVRPVQGPDGRIHELQAATRDVTAQVVAEQRLTRLALADPLTGLANRAALTQDIEERLAGELSVTLLFLDLDRFKVVNDSLGHSAGDELLRTVAARLAGACRDGDVVSRLGGDEFVVVASGLEEDGAVRLADRVQAVLSEPVAVSGHEVVVTASVGIVVASPGDADQDAETLLQGADVSMYRAKATGRARAVVWTEAIGTAATTRLDLERELREALGCGELVVHYQPQVELDTGRVVGLEALVRWAHPTRQLLPPSAFLGIADDTGMVVELGRQVLATALGELVAWRRLPGHGDLALSVNLSGQELMSRGRAAQIAVLLRETGLPADALTLEVLESVLLDPQGDVRSALASYVDIGVEIALDDFGTGSSSLLHLRDLPVGALKVDRRFVAGLGRSYQDEAIVRAMCVLADDLGLRCLAEGVERERQRAWLVAHGVRVAQGFLLSRPVPAEQVEALLTR